MDQTNLPSLRTEFDTANNLVIARGAVKVAQGALETAIKEHYPIGAGCNYRRALNTGWQAAQVDMHGYNGDVRVRIMDTGRLVWVRGAYEGNLSR